MFESCPMCDNLTPIAICIKKVGKIRHIQLKIMRRIKRKMIERGKGLWSWELGAGTMVEWMDLGEKKWRRRRSRIVGEEKLGKWNDGPDQKKFRNFSFI